MVRKNQRFHGRKHIRHVLSRGETLRSNLWSIKGLATRGQGRVAVVVSAKVAPKAVDRNRIRRRIFEAIRISTEDISKDVDYIVIVNNKDTLNRTFTELKRELIEDCNKVCSMFK